MIELVTVLERLVDAVQQLNKNLENGTLDRIRPIGAVQQVLPLGAKPTPWADFREEQVRAMMATNDCKNLEDFCKRLGCSVITVQKGMKGVWSYKVQALLRKIHPDICNHEGIFIMKRLPSAEEVAAARIKAGWRPIQEWL